MKKLLSRWSFNKHVLLCLIILGITTIIFKFITSPKHASNIGIIGGVDGPTAIFLTGDPRSTIIFISVLILLALYKPPKKIIKKL